LTAVFPLILASRSPQRRAILEQLGVPHQVRVPEVDELEGGEPQEAALANARRKAAAVAGAEPAATVLAADTVVALGGRILGKPADETQAREWLDVLSGRTHEVLGGLVVTRAGVRREAVALTRVSFRRLGRADIDWYAASGEWRERAGGYAIQGRGAALVTAIDGDYSNVVGLPVAALLELLPDLLS
jgi:septum formation protein